MNQRPDPAALADLLSAPNRLDLIQRMAPEGLRCVDVGCDHGHISRALNAVASERELHRLPRRTDVPRVVADGLKGHKNVELAILTGMGPQLILKILAAGPAPQQAIVHSPQHSHVLRVGLKRLGWKVHRQGLAPENGRYAEVMHIRPGASPYRDFDLGFGGALIEHPWAHAHARRLHADWSRLASDAPPHTAAHKKASSWMGWLDTQFPAETMQGAPC